MAMVMKKKSIVYNKVMSIHDPSTAECIRDNVRRKEQNLEDTDTYEI